MRLCSRYLLFLPNFWDATVLIFLIPLAEALEAVRELELLPALTLY